MKQTLSLGYQNGLHKARVITKDVRDLNLENKKHANQSNSGKVNKDVKVRTQFTCSVSSLNGRHLKTTIASKSSGPTRANQNAVNKDFQGSAPPAHVNPYRNMNLLTSARSRKNVFFSESEPGQGVADSSDTDSDGDINQVRRANGHISVSCSSLPGTSVSATSSKGEVIHRWSSASARPAISPKVIPTTASNYSSPRPGTSRPGTSCQRKLLKHHGPSAKAKDRGNAEVSPRPPQLAKRSISKDKSNVGRTQRKPLDRNHVRKARELRRGRPRCVSTASVDDGISNSSSSSNNSSPRGHSSHKRLHSPQSSVETPPPGTARSSALNSGGPNANSIYSMNLAWSMFENHVKLIDDCTGSLSNVPRRTFMSSPVFQNVMTDLYGRPEYSKTRAFLQLRSRIGNVAAFASRFLGRVKALHAMRASSEDLDDEDDDFDFVDFDDDGEGFINGRRRQPSAQTVENAKRAWKILRNRVMEEAAKKRMSRPALAWDVIRHTLRAGSNLERARLDIYQRYGLIPMVLPDGRVVQENTMLSERARQAQANKPQRTATHSNSSISRQSLSTPSKRTIQFKSIQGFNGYSRSETM
ncbi:hypothetical protein RRG08_021740 [Elysia crispata]|uniref:Uncharacterized protein n=1 Tax=Elysia crispata TaxID=231223 RepID=A0AAE0ZXS2_9GAST|nr:hypothetical protein RRG08_021740 [Elysia crispata]